MKRIAAASVVLLLTGCGGGGDPEAEPESTSEPTAAPSASASEPGVEPMTLDTACSLFSTESDEADVMDAVANAVQDPISGAFEDLASAVRAQDGATGETLLDARADARDAAAQIDAVCP